VEAETLCADTLDNEGDGDTDCADSDCAERCDAGVTVKESDCGNALDDDQDGDADCADADCAHRFCNSLKSSVCCGTSCVNLSQDPSHCGGCGLRCASGLGCRIVRQGGGAACYQCTANSQCSGGNTSLATCWTRALGGGDYCRCQSDAACAPGQRCHKPMNNTDNYCYYP